MITKMTGRISIVMGSSALLIGCVPHLTQEQCQTINWYQMGLNDGMHGQFQRSLQREIKDCAKFKIEVKTNRYHKGWLAGARKFCRPGTAYQLGVDGQTYNPICPADLANRFERSWRRGLKKYCIPSTGYNLGRSGKAYPSFCSPNQVVRFRNAYDSGRRIYNAIESIQSEINNTNADMYSVAFEIRHKKRDIRNWNSQLSDVKGKQRKQLRNQMKQAQHEINRLNKRMDNLQHHKNMLQGQLNRQEARG